MQTIALEANQSLDLTRARGTDRKSTTLRRRLMTAHVLLRRAARAVCAKAGKSLATIGAILTFAAFVLAIAEVDVTITTALVGAAMMAFLPGYISMSYEKTEGAV